ncbi:MAG: hypothetical protein KDB47_13815 [Mycobacterium sp.]|nr:hypothetical protein [Mycobacterium sp.]
MRQRWAMLRYRWRRIPMRTRMGALIAVVAIAGLTWQYYSVEDVAQTAEQVAPGEIDHEGHDHGPEDGHAHGEYQPDPSELPPPPDFSPEAARVIAERFASNFASPNGNREDWIARVAPDVMPELLDQYRLTDIRNVPQASVAKVDGPLAADPFLPTFQIAYSDGSAVETTLEMAVDGWKISTVVPVQAQAPPPPAAPADPAQPPAAPAPSSETVAPTSAIPGAIPISLPTP